MPRKVQYQIEGIRMHMLVALVFVFLYVVSREFREVVNFFLFVGFLLLVVVGGIMYLASKRGGF